MKERYVLILRIFGLKSEFLFLRSSRNDFRYLVGVHTITNWGSHEVKEGDTFSGCHYQEERATSTGVVIDLVKTVGHFI